MRKNIPIILVLVLISFFSNSQTATIHNTVGAYSGNAVVGQSNYYAQENIYLDSEIGVSNFIGVANAISKIGFSVNAITAVTYPLTISNYKIYMKNVSSANTVFTTGTYSLTDYTLVYDGSLTFNSTGWNEFSLTTPFARTAGTNLQVLCIRNNNTINSGLVFDCSTGNSSGTSVNSARRYNSTTIPTENSTSLTATSFRPSIVLKRTVNTDVSAASLTGGPANITCNNAPTSFTVTIKNTGTATTLNAASVSVQLSLSGANTYTSSLTNTNTLLPTATEAITFNNIPIPNSGSTTATVITTYLGDLDPSNDTTRLLFSNASVITSMPAIESAESTLSVFSWVKLLSTAQAWSLSGNYKNADLSDTLKAKDGSIYYKFDSYNNVSGTSSRLYSNCLTIPSNSYQASYWISHDTSWASANDSLYVSVTNNGGVTWTRLAGYQRFDASFLTTGWKKDSISLSAYAGQTIQIGFEGVSKYGNAFGLDLITIGVNSAVTPISYSDFKGTREGVNNLLQWTTANEINNLGFELQRSINGTEFTTITKIASKADNGNSATSLNYSYTDRSPLKGINYYRIYQLDKDGKGTYSKIVAIKNSTKGVEISNVYPNPTKDNISLTINSLAKNQYTISIYDMIGKEIARKSVDVNGSMNVQFNTSDFAKGTYVIKVTSSENTVLDTQKFIKQ